MSQPGAEKRQIPLSFNTPYIDAPTKAAGWQNAEMPATYSTSEHLSVFGLFHTGSFASLSATDKASSKNIMADVDCAYNATYNCWDPAAGDAHQAYYWPAIPSIRFTVQAYSPSAARTDMTVSHNWETGFSFSGFQVQPAGQQYDLLFTRRHPDRQKSQYTETDTTYGGAYDDETDAVYTYNGIDLHFYHALSLLTFEVNPGYDDGASAQRIMLKSISLLNVYDRGGFSQGLDPSVPDDAGSPAWTPDNSHTANYLAFNSTSGYELHAGWNNSTESAAFKACCNTLMVLPQPLSHAPSDNVKIRVVYSRISGGMETENTILVDLATGNNGGYYQDDHLNEIQSWEIGKRYIYKLNLGFHKVFIDPDVTPWVNGGESTIEL